MSDQKAWREERRQVAIDPNATLEQLHAVAAMFPVEVLQNPVLPLEAMVDQRLYEDVVRRAWNNLSKTAWENVLDSFLPQGTGEKFFLWCRAASLTLPEPGNTVSFLETWRGRDMSDRWIIEKMETALEDGFAAAKIREIFGDGRVSAMKLQGHDGNPVAWARIGVMVHAADALHEMLKGRPYPWPVTTMKPNRRRARR